MNWIPYCNNNLNKYNFNIELTNYIMENIVKNEEKLDTEMDVKLYHPLNDTWVIWIHKIYDKNWLKESYKQIYKFNTIEGFWKFYNSIPDFSMNMFFIMREGVFPLWEDKHNIDGGTWSYIIEKEEINSYWKTMSIKLIGETLTNYDSIMDINGISLSPRTNVAIIKIWNKTASKQEQIKLNIEQKYLDNLRYKLHKND